MSATEATATVVLPEPEPAANPLGPRLAATFNALNAAGIRYVVLRGYMPLDELERTADIDMYMPPEELERAAPILEAHGWLRRRWQTGRYPHVFFDDWTSPHAVVRSIDVVTDICFSAELLALPRARALLERRTRIGDVAVMTPWVATFLFALHVALDKGVLSSANRARAIQMRAQCDASTAQQQGLQRAFGRTASQLVHALFQAAAADTPETFEGLRRAAREVELKPLRWKRLESALLRAAKMRARPRVRVALLGCDGSGKSTLVDALCAMPSTVPLRSGYLGENGFRTWPAVWLKRQLTRADLSRTGPMYRLLANAYAIWWPVEIAARMYIAERYAHVVLYDRFPFAREPLAEKRTSLHGRLMEAYRKAALRLLPSPDIVLLLDGDPETIWKRKQEFPFETHLRLRAAYRKHMDEVACERAEIPADQGVNEASAAVRSVFARSASVAEKLYAQPPGAITPVR